MCSLRHPVFNIAAILLAIFTTAPPPAPTTSAPPVVSIEVVDYNNCSVYRDEDTGIVSHVGGMKMVLPVTALVFKDGSQHGYECSQLNLSTSPSLCGC